MAKQVKIPVASEAYLSSMTISPLRARLVADLVRGKSLEVASRTLLLEKVKAAKIIFSILKSAAANAQQKGVADLDRLYISELQVNEGPRIKRFMPRAQGRADARLTRTSHIILKLSERAGASAPAKKSTKKSPAGKS